MSVKKNLQPNLLGQYVKLRQQEHEEGKHTCCFFTIEKNNRNDYSLICCPPFDSLLEISKAVLNGLPT